MKMIYRLSNFITIVVTLFWLQIPVSIRAEESTSQSPPEAAYSLREAATEKVRQGAVLSEEEYNALAKDKAPIVYVSSPRLLVYSYDAPNKQPTLEVLDKKDDDILLTWKLRELEINIRKMYIENQKDKELLATIMQDINDIKLRLGQIEEKQAVQ